MNLEKNQLIIPNASDNEDIVTKEIALEQDRYSGFKEQFEVQEEISSSLPESMADCFKFTFAHNRIDNQLTLDLLSSELRPENMVILSFHALHQINPLDKTITNTFYLRLCRALFPAQMGNVNIYLKEC